MVWFELVRTHRGPICKAFLLVSSVACASTVNPATSHTIEPDNGLSASIVKRTSRAGFTGPCAGLEVKTNASAEVSGPGITSYRWNDTHCLARDAVMLPNDRQDASGKWGGYMRQYAYRANGASRTCAETQAQTGFGYVVADNTASNSINGPGKVSTPLQGAHHAIQRYQWLGMPVQGQPVDVTVEWFFATGRDHPLWSITFDTSKLAPDAVRVESRSPYGDIAWDGGGGHAVSGVGWGDRYKFRSLATTLSMQSGWDYTELNTIPYAMEWASEPDAEMGLVQTQPYSQHDAGGNWSYKRWNTRDDDGPMPEDWNWTYQLNQYELPFTNSSKRLAWGTNSGAVGGKAYPAYGDDKTLSGWPYQSYSVYIVLGTHSGGAVASTVKELEAVQRVKFVASIGGVVAEGPAGVGRTDVAQYTPAGWDHVHGVFALAGERGTIQVTIEAPEVLKNPMFHLAGTHAAQVLLDGEQLSSGVDYYATFDARDGTVWLTFGGPLAGTHELRFSDG